MQTMLHRWSHIILVALALQACGDQQQDVQNIKRQRKVVQSTSDQNSGTVNTGNDSFPSANDSNNFPNSGGTNNLPNTGTGTPDVSPTPTPTPTPDTTNGRVLNMATVYNQGSTQYCWAYSTFHALRTYFNNDGANEPNGAAWRDALAKMDSSTNLMNFMKERYNTQRTGFPKEFLALMEKTYNLPSFASWTENYTGMNLVDNFEGFGSANLTSVDYAPVSTNRGAKKDDVLAKAREQINKGMPAVYCDSGHCMSIYGYSKSGSSFTYNVADSIGGKKYTETEAKVKQRVYMMMIRAN